MCLCLFLYHWAHRIRERYGGLALAFIDVFNAYEYGAGRALRLLLQYGLIRPHRPIQRSGANITGVLAGLRCVTAVRLFPVRCGQRRLLPPDAVLYRATAPRICIEMDVNMTVQAAGLSATSVLPVFERDDAETLFARKRYNSMFPGCHCIMYDFSLACRFYVTGFMAVRCGVFVFQVEGPKQPINIDVRHDDQHHGHKRAKRGRLFSWCRQFKRIYAFAAEAIEIGKCGSGSRIVYVHPESSV